MATHKSALKRHTQSERRRVRNHAVRSRVRNAIKHVNEAIAAREATEATARLRTAERLLSKAVTKGVLHMNTASRHISRLSRRVNSIRAA
jgi:small subunit ribosomal protein S20